MWWIQRKRPDGRQGLGDRWEGGETSEAKNAPTLMADTEWPLDPDMPPAARTWLTPYEWVNL